MFVPHTPRWLVQRGREDEARSVLTCSRPKEKIDEEIDEEIDGIREAAQSQHAFQLRQLFGPRLRMLLLVGAGMAMFQQILGPIFWVMIAEIYPLRSRAKAMAAATMVNWTFNFLISYFFLQMTKDITRAGTFWLYAGFGVAAVAFFIWKLPETKDRSLEDIERQVHG